MSTFSDFYLSNNSPLTASNQSYVSILNEAGFPGSLSMSSLSSEFGAVVTWVRARLGFPILEVELPPVAIAACFQEANAKFSQITSAYYMQSWAAQMLGIEKNYNEFSFQNALPKANNIFQQAFAANLVSPYNAGLVEKRRGYFITSPNVSRYDIFSNGYDANSNMILEQYVASVSGWDVHVDNVYYNAGYYVNRFYDPLSNQQFLHSEFGFPSYGSDTVFYLNPLWEDLKRGSLLKTSDDARKPKYSWYKHYRNIEITPHPTVNGLNIWFDYYIDVKPGTGRSPLSDSSFSGLGYLSTSNQNQATHFGNIPIENLTYDKMNDTGRTWVKEYTFITSMWTLGEAIRSKYGSIPIPGPNGESLTLNGATLAATSESRRTEIINQLEKWLDNMDAYKITEKEQIKREQQVKMMLLDPMPVPFMVY